MNRNRKKIQVEDFITKTEYSELINGVWDNLRDNVNKLFDEQEKQKAVKKLLKNEEDYEHLKIEVFRCVVMSLPLCLPKE